MHDNVERDLEEMLPELDALLEKRLFTKEELRQVLKARAKFEYAIRGAQRTPQDFYKYIEYEQKLEELRRIRSNRLKNEGQRVKKSDLGEFCIVRHIHSIFSRATYVFKSEIELWKQWFAFCQTSHSPQRLSKVPIPATENFTGASVGALRRLEIQPMFCGALDLRSSLLEERQNVNMARSLMQQGLRNCSSSKSLWLAYFKMELTIAEKLWKRQQILETPPETGEGDRPSLERLVDGSMAMCVFNEAISVFPTELEFRKQFLDNTAEAVISQPELLIEQIFNTIQQDFKDSAEMWDMSARYAFERSSTLDLISRLEAAMKVFSDGLHHRASSELYSYALVFLCEIWQSCHQDNDSEQDSSQTAFLSALFLQMESVLNAALDDTGVDASALLGFLEISKSRKDVLAVLDVLQRALQGGTLSASLTQLYIEAIRDAFAERVLDRDEATEALMKALQNSGVCWSQVLEALCQLDLPFAELLERHLMHLSKLSSVEERRHASQSTCDLLDTLIAQGHVAEALEWGNRLILSPFVEASVYLKLIDIYSTQLESHSQTVSWTALNQLCEKAIRSYGGSDVDIWIAVLHVEHRHRNRDFGRIFQRAQYSGIRDLSRLEHAVRTLK